VAKTMTWLIVAGGMVLLAGALALAGLRGTPETVNSAAAIGLVTASAVGIERVVETFWAVASQLATDWWPLSVPVKQVDAFMIRLNQQLQPVVDLAERVVGAAETDASSTSARLATARAQLETLKANLNQVTVTEPPSQARAASMIAAIDALATWDARLSQGAAAAKTAIADLSGAVSAFSNNPARKLISLFAGAILGIGLAAVAHVDLFRASGIADTQLGPYQWGVAITGVVMGLGSNPAHELINAITQFKIKQRQAASSGSG